MEHSAITSHPLFPSDVPASFYPRFLLLDCLRHESFFANQTWKREMSTEQYEECVEELLQELEPHLSVMDRQMTQLRLRMRALAESDTDYRGAAEDPLKVAYIREQLQRNRLETVRQLLLVLEHELALLPALQRSLAVSPVLRIVSGIAAGRHYERESQRESFPDIPLDPLTQEHCDQVLDELVQFYRFRVIQRIAARFERRRLSGVERELFDYERALQTDCVLACSRREEYLTTELGIATLDNEPEVQRLVADLARRHASVLYSDPRTAGAQVMAYRLEEFLKRYEQKMQVAERTMQHEASGDTFMVRLKRRLQQWGRRKIYRQLSRLQATPRSLPAARPKSGLLDGCL